MLEDGTADESPADRPPGRRWSRRRLGLCALTALSVVALLLLVVHLVWPARVDAITLGLLVFMALPGLGLVLDSAELPGGVKLQFRTLSDRVERTEENARVALGAATEQASLSRARRERGVPSPDPPPEAARCARSSPPDRSDPDDSRRRPPGSPAETPVHGTVAQLARQYQELRRRRRGGRERTARMTDLVGKLIARTATDTAFDPVGALSGDDGLRLAAYVYAYSQPVPQLLPLLVPAVLAEKLPFSQYWGLKAVRHLLRDTRAQPPPGLADDLRWLSRHVGSDPSRVDQIDRILDLLRGR